MDDSILKYVVIPALIFFARVTDVSIGTVRIIMLSRGNKIVAPILGFFEVIIWLAAISQVMQNLSNVVCYLAYGAGFATGNYVGLLIESRLALGLQIVRIISSKPLQILPGELRNEGFGVTEIDGKGAKGPVKILYSIVPRKRVNDLISLVHYLDPDAFISIEDVRSSYAGYFRNATRGNVFQLRKIFKKK